MGEHNKNCKDVSRPTVGTRYLLLKLVQLADLVKGGHLLVELVHASVGRPPVDLAADDATLFTFGGFLSPTRPGVIFILVLLAACS